MNTEERPGHEESHPIMLEARNWKTLLVVILTSILLLVPGILAILRGVGWLRLGSEESPFLRFGMLVVGATIVAIWLVLVAFVALFRREPLRIAEEGLYVPSYRLVFRRNAHQRLVAKSEISVLNVQKSGGLLKVIVIDKSGDRRTFFCSIDLQKRLEEFLHTTPSASSTETS